MQDQSFEALYDAWKSSVSTMDLTKINKVGMLASFLPVKKLSELSLERDYGVTDIRCVKTTFGTRFAVDIEEAFTCYLPARFVKVFEEDANLLQQVKMGAHDKNLFMRYHGTHYNNVEFKAGRQIEG